MRAFKAIFLLSLLAIILSPENTQAQDIIKPEWSKFAKCSHLFIESVTYLARKIVPAVYDLNQCSGYEITTPEPNGLRTLLWYSKVTYEFVKKLVLDKPKCLLTLVDKVKVALRPYCDQIKKVGCLDEDDNFF